MAKPENTSTEDFSKKIVSHQSSDDDLLDPYYLHHSDTPGSLLVSQVLTGDNYVSWSRSMRIALDIKNKLGFIDGSIQKPESEDPKLLRKWRRNNGIVLAWILNSVSKEIYASLLYGETAAEIWKDLEERFQQSNAPNSKNLSAASRFCSLHPRTAKCWPLLHQAQRNLGGTQQSSP